MFLDKIGNELILSPNGERLKIRYISQLGLWGFKEVNGDYKLYNCKEEVLFKVISFLKYSNIDLILTKRCENYIRSIEEKKDEFNKIYIYLREYKKGHVNENSFKKHVNSLKDLNRILKDHQIKASYHLYNSKNGANFSVPGSGKTSVVLAVYHRLKKEGKVDALFVIGPPSCFGTWRYEFEEVFGRSPEVTILAGGNITSRKEEYFKNTYSELYLSTFQTVARDCKDIPRLFTTAKIFLVIDEAHYIKQIGGEWATAVLSIGPYAKYKTVLTGTPMPKSYTDFYNLFDFLFPDNNILNNTHRIILKNHETNRDINSATNLLEKTIGPLFYRVRKTDLGLANQIFCEPIKIKMNPYEWKIYNAILTRIINYSRGDYDKNIDYVKKLILGRMMRLRQCTSYTKLLSTTIEEYDEDLLDDAENLKKIVFNYDKYETPAKLEKLIEIVNTFVKNDHKVLIWSNFIGTVKLIENELKANQLSCKKIIGDTPTEKMSIEEEETRESIRREFIDENSSLRILIANPAACAESISLHKSCNNAIYYDHSYNCAQYMQSLDRIHRVGGSEERPSYYHFLQYENSIDIGILENLNKKAQKMAALLDKDYEIYSLDMFDVSDEVDGYYQLINK